MRARRIVITGSRTWPWPAFVARVLDAERARLAAGDSLTVVHGACRAGADAAAAAWCASAAQRTGARVVEEPHPAAWRDQSSRLDRSAGMVRNAALIATKPDLVIAFWADHSPGTADTLRRAADARLPALVYIAYTSTGAPSPVGTPHAAHPRPTGHRSRVAEADARAELTMNQGYDANRNPVCPACNEQTSLTGQCACG